jgi:hypothetical protein
MWLYSVNYKNMGLSLLLFVNFTVVAQFHQVINKNKRNIPIVQKYLYYLVDIQLFEVNAAHLFQCFYIKNFK